eukprot:g10427.t1
MSVIHGPQRHPLETNADTISEVLSYCPENDFLFLAGVSKGWKGCWERSGRPRLTSVSLATATASRVDGVLDQPSFHAASSHLGGVLCLAAQAGNLGGVRAAASKIGDDWAALGAAVTMTGIAASEGHLDVLRWAVAAGCRLSVHTMRCAIEGGHLGVVRWGSEQGSPWPADACRLAALGGHLGILRLARAAGLPWSEETCMSAAEAGDLETLRFARRSGCPWDSRTASSAAWGNSFEVLKWVVSEGCPVNNEVSHGAALSGNLAMLWWLKEEGYPFDRRTCSYAALGGHLEVLRFLRSAECSWDEDTPACATQGGHLEVLQWAIAEAGCPWNVGKCARIAASRRHTELVEWIEAHASDDFGVGFIPTNINPATCNPAAGDTVTITGNLKVNTNAASDRFDVGFGVGPYPDTAPGGFLCDVYGFTCDDANLDPPNDICADFAQAASFFEGVEFEVPCQLDGDGRVLVDYCVSWKTVGQNEECTSVDDIFPDPGSKCQCGEVTVPVCPAVSLSIGDISLSGTSCADPVYYDIPIDGMIPAGFAAVFAIKDAEDEEVTGTATSGNVISAPLTPGDSYTIEVTLTEVVGGVTLECPAIKLDLAVVPGCCADDADNCFSGEFCCPEQLVCKPGMDELTACGDPHMTGFLGQKFDFTGEDGEWYALIADDNMHVNMRVSCPVANLPEITYITGLSVITTDEDGFDHSIVIEVKDPHNLESSCPAGVSPCLADGSLRVILDGEEALIAPGTVSLGRAVQVSAANLPGACRSFGFEKYWELKKLEYYAVHARRLGGTPPTMAEWILGDPTATNMVECQEYVTRAEAGKDGVFSHQSEHASFQILTPKAIVRLNHGRLHQVAMRDPTDQYDLPEHLTWQMNMAVDSNEVSHNARGILGETFVPTRDVDGMPIMTGMEAIRGTQEEYRVEKAVGTYFSA